MSASWIFFFEPKIIKKFHKAKLPINHNFNKMCYILGSFLNQKTRNSEIFSLAVKKKSHLSARVMARTVQLLRRDAYWPIKLSN